MSSYAEINDLQAKTEGIENNLEFLINTADDRGIHSGTVTAVNSLVDQCNLVCDLAEEMIDKPVEFGRVKEMSKSTEAEFLDTIMTIRNKSNRVKRVLEGYKEDINILDLGDGLKIHKSGHNAWKELRSEYMRNLDYNDEKIILDESIKRMIHTSRKSTIFHSVATHLEENRIELAENPEFEYNLLESSSLQSVYSLRESIFNLVNVIWELEIDTGPNKKWKSNIKKQIDNSEIENVLGSLIGGSFNDYLVEYRHPDVHDEVLSKVSRENIAEATTGKPRGHIEEFITETKNISEKLEHKETRIVNEIREKLS